jgi:hypothetical protein
MTRGCVNSWIDEKMDTNIRWLFCAALDHLELILLTA